MAIRQHGIASKILSGPACTLSVMVTDPHPPDPGEDRKVNQLNAESEESSKPDDEKLHQAADALDSVAEHDSEYRRYAAARDVFVDHRMVDDESDDTDSGNHLTLEHRAAWWSLRYQLDFDRSSGSERVRLLPEFRGPDSTNPPDTRSVDSTIVATWEVSQDSSSTPRPEHDFTTCSSRSAAGTDSTTRVPQSPHTSTRPH